MKKYISPLLITLLLLGCSEKLYVSSDHDKNADFSTYKTYAWAKEQEEPGKDHPMFDNEMNRKRIREAIDAEMLALGFLRFDWAPDLLIDFHISINMKTNYIEHMNYPFRFSYWPEYDISSYTFKKGALVIHLVDSKKEQLVWQGTGTKTLGDVPPENAEERIIEGVKSIFEAYPGRIKK